MNQDNNAYYLERTQNGTSFSGSDVNVFQVTALAMGLRLYAATGMKPNRAYTPTNMLKMATQFTGKTYKRGEFEKAAVDLLAYADVLKSTPRTTS